MEKLEINIYNLKQKVTKAKLHSQKCKHKMDNETSIYISPTLEKEYKASVEDLNQLIKELKNEEEADKKEKLAYKKHLTKVKDSLNEFYKISRTNSKIKKHIAEINTAIVYIDKYLG